MSTHLVQGGRRFATVVLLAILSLSKCMGQDVPRSLPVDVGVSPHGVKKLSDYMQSLVDKGEIVGGVTLFARYGKIVHLKAVGMADREAGKAMTGDAIFRIASMTKPITSAAIMILHDRGQLSLNDPVSKYVSAFKDPKVIAPGNPTQVTRATRGITIHHLLTHTSGLTTRFDKTLGPRYAYRGIVAGVARTKVSLCQNVQQLAQVPLLFNPGEQWTYGMSTDVLGLVIETISQQDLNEFIRQEICDPLGMRDTHFRLPEEKRERLVSAYLASGSHLRKIGEGQTVMHESGEIQIEASSDYPYSDDHRYSSGGAGLCSTATDYFRFCQMILNGGELNGTRVLRQTTVDMMTTNQTELVPDAPPFGYGFRIIPNDATHEQLRESLSWSGFWTTNFRASPQGQWVMVALAQRAWDSKLSPTWGEHYSQLAAEAIAD